MSESKKHIKPKYLLDTSAIMTFIEDEAGAQIVSDILNKAKNGHAEIYISFMSVMETCYKVYQEKDEQCSRKIFNYLAHLPVKRVDVNDELILRASFLKGTHYFSMADAWILATAKYLNACLVHKDPEFEEDKDTPKIALPYKSKKS